LEQKLKKERVSMANYGSDSDTLTNDHERGAFSRGVQPIGILDREYRCNKQKTAAIVGFQQIHPDAFAFLEEASAKLKKAKSESPDQLPLVGIETWDHGLSRLLVNGTKTGLEQHFDCAFRITQQGVFQVGASHRTFEVFDEEQSSVSATK
jgi:hypothetical protein